MSNENAGPGRMVNSPETPGGPSFSKNGLEPRVRTVANGQSSVVAPVGMRVTAVGPSMVTTVPSDSGAQIPSDSGEHST